MPDFEKAACSVGKNVQVVETGVNDCSIDTVVVYRDRAEVRRAVPVTLTVGENQVIIYGLSEYITEDSIRVEGKGDAVITDVIYSNKTSEIVQEVTPGSKKEYEVIKEEIEQVNLELKHLEFKEEVLKKQKELLAKFANDISSIHSMKEKNDTMAQLVHNDSVTAVMEFFEKYEAKVADLDGHLATLTQDKKEVEGRSAVLQVNADKLNPNKVTTSTEHRRTVHVGLETAAEASIVLYLSYVVQNASWNSSYDARVFTKDKSMKVQYYGLIKQSTGEDWEDAKISLSTAQPAIGGGAPALPTKIIRFKRPVMKHTRAYVRSERMGEPMGRSAKARGSYNSESSDEEFQSIITTISLKASYGTERFRAISPPKTLEVAVAEVKSGLFNTTYDIPRAATIPADNTEHKVTVALVDLSPEFHYSSVPRLSPHSFLQAKAKNISPYTILAGPANIFLDNNFIAKSELPDVSPNEEFTTSLGVDQSLRITCQPVEAVHNTRSKLGGNKAASVSYTHKFLVKNTKTHSVNIHLSEQVPLSTDDRIKVQLTCPEGVRKPQVKCVLPCGGYAVLNESNNMEWHITVEPGAEQELKLVYSVEHPAQDHVQGLPK